VAGASPPSTLPGNPTEGELVTCDANDPEAAWYMKEYGGGVMVPDPIVSGRTFIAKERLDEYEDWSSFFVRWILRS
jgi:hypothetical protein